MSKLSFKMRNRVIGNNCCRCRLLAGWVAALLWLGQSVWAATFTVALDRDTVTLGENVTLSLNFVGGTPQAIPTPQVPGLQIDYVGRSSQFSDINGQVSSTVSHNFSVRPQQAGEFTIPSMPVDIGGQKLSSQPVILKVLKPTAP